MMMNSKDPVLSQHPETYSLPYDILYSIFELLWSEGLDQKSLVAASHVCRSWRAAAIESPKLWSNIAFTSQPPFNRETLWLERSEATGLAITLPRNYNFKATGQLISLIKPHVARWRSLEITRTFKTASYRLIFDAIQQDHAAMLESLEVANIGEHDTWTFQPFTGGAPKLRRVHLTYSRLLAGSAMFDHLEELVISRLSSPSWNHPISVQDFLCILAQAAQTLVKVDVRGCSFGHDSQPMALSASITLPRLTTLDLPRAPSPYNWLIQIYCAVLAPAVYYHPFDIRALLHFAIHSIFPFPGLRVLRMEKNSVEPNTALDRTRTATLFRLLNELESITSYGVDFSFQVLGSQCTKLRSLSIWRAQTSTMGWSGFKDMVEARRMRATAVGVVDTLTWLELRYMTLADEEVAWLHSNVRDFKYTMPLSNAL